MWFKCGLGPVQVRAVQVRFKSGSSPVQVRLNYIETMSQSFERIAASSLSVSAINALRPSANFSVVHPSWFMASLRVVGRG